MKRVLLACALAALILLPVTTAVNLHTSKNGPLAQGMPAPPWPPEATGVLAQGMPAPPWPPEATGVLAQGMPAPPWPPDKVIVV